MYDFPGGLYTDVRIEDVFETSIRVTLGEVEERKEKAYSAAFATPVQLAYLFDGKTLVGRLPELNLSSHLYDMLGKDFIGVSTDSLTPLARMNLIGMRMEVRKS